MSQHEPDLVPLDADQWIRRFGWTVLVAPVLFVLALPIVTGLLDGPQGPGPRHVLIAVVSAALVTVFGLAMVTLVQRAYRQVDALQRRTIAAERHGAVLEERGRIAREMHDGLAQTLAVVHLRLRALDADPTVAGDSRVRAELAELAGMCQESSRDVRENILGLREDARTDSGLREAMERLLASFTRSTGIEATLECDPPELDLPGEQRAQVSRVVQEALTNVRKHSGARSVRITMAQARDGLRVVVHDDGRGFDTTAVTSERSFGLHTMRERIEHLGGRLTLVSRPGEGTTVLAEVPSDRALEDAR